MNTDEKVYVSRLAVRQLLSGRPTAGVLRARAGALQRLHDDIAHFMDWPALCESLQQDIAALQAARP